MLWLAVLAALLPRPRPAEAEALSFEGTLTVDLLDPELPSPAVSGSGVAIALPTASGGLALETLRIRGGISDHATVVVTDPDVVGVAAVAATATLGIGTLRPFQPPAFFGPQLTTRTLPVAGLVRVCLFSAACTSGVAVPLSIDGGAVGVGVGGMITIGGADAVRLSLQAAPWTIGTASVAVRTPGGSSATALRFGFARGPASVTGTTATAGGEIQLVTPMRVFSNQAPDLSGFGVARLRFVPEPGSLLLHVSGVAGLLVLGRRRFRP